MLTSRNNKRLVAAAVVVLLAALAPAAEKIFFMAPNRKHAVHDLTKKLSPDGLASRSHDRTPYSESIFYQFSNHDGVDFFTHIMFMDAGFTIKRFGLDFKVRYPDGKTHYFGRQIDVDECSLSRERFSWKLGNNSAEGDLDTHRLVINEHGLELDVTFKMIAPIYRAGEAGMIYMDPEQKKWGQLTFFTCFSAEGTLKDGETLVPVKGWGYGDYIRGNFIVTEFTRYCSGLRFYQDGLGFDIIDYITTDKYGSEWLPVLLVHKDGRLIHVSLDCERTVLDYYTEPRSGKRIPASYRIRSRADDVSVDISFTQVQLADYNDPFIILSPVERYLIDLISDAPLDLRFNGRVDVSVTTPRETVTRQGQAYSLFLISD